MTLQDAESHELEMLAVHEEVIGELYETYAKLFPERKEFWQHLAGEERGHAAWLRSMQSRVEDGAITFNEDRFVIKAIQTSVNFIRQWITNASSQDILNALAVAFDIENGLIDRDFFKVYETDDDELRKIFNSLTEATRKHRNMIASVLEEVRDGMPPEVAIG